MGQNVMPPLVRHSVEVPRSAGVGAVGGEFVELRAERGIRPVPEQAPGEPIMGECDSRNPGSTVGLVVAQPPQFRRRERGDWAAAGGLGEHVGAKLGDEFGGSIR